MNIIIIIKAGIRSHSTKMWNCVISLKHFEENLGQISKLIYCIYPPFLPTLYLAQVFVFRGFLKTSHSALNGQVIREGIFQRHGLQSSIENCLKSTNNSQNAFFQMYSFYELSYMISLTKGPFCKAWLYWIFKAFSIQIIFSLKL